MANKVGANGQSIVTKKSKGTVMCGPDVCKTQVGNAVVPIPYPNIAQSSDLDKGTKSVKVGGAPACLSSSNFKKSTGDQPGKLGGIISGQSKAMAEPIMYSFNVKMDGKNVVRNMDLFVSNSKNTPPGPVMQAPSPPVILMDLESTAEGTKCEYCGEESHAFAESFGNSVGSGPKLRKNIIKKISDHPWYSGPRSLQAHHLICSEAMSDDDWPSIASRFGYDINHKNNGVMLPNSMALACQLHAPLHRGNHDKGKASGLSYPDKIKKDIDEFMKKARKGDFCSNSQGIVDELDAYSEQVVGKIDKFRWTITGDGKDYKDNGNGCSGVTSLTNKPSNKCPDDRKHNLKHAKTKKIIGKKSKSLSIGS
ncbi:PAAR-like domain-containing protein [Agaribacterium haliotis]|uniref:PAAR-like domain-containing protein n=1 Tax=Agaribacterium haliotis TaxID=2013869 RepID=UPI000BB59D2F|nr:PAAR-like domain-containing protein [Agaribacterium haliotis]